jgi:hypothetical protein
MQSLQASASTMGCLGFMVILAGAGVFTRIGEFSHGRSWYDLLAAGVAGAAFVFFSVALVAGIRDSQRGRIVPYFRRRLGIKGLAPFNTGETLAHQCEYIDQVARELGLAPISSFGFADDAQGGRVSWHSSEEGLRTVTALRNHFIKATPRAPHHARLAEDLAAIEKALEEAVKQEVPFAFILRSGGDKFISPPEMDRRQGSFW